MTSVLGLAMHSAIILIVFVIFTTGCSRAPDPQSVVFEPSDQQRLRSIAQRISDADKAIITSPFHPMTVISNDQWRALCGILSSDENLSIKNDRKRSAIAHIRIVKGDDAVAQGTVFEGAIVELEGIYFIVPETVGNELDRYFDVNL